MAVEVEPSPVTPEEQGDLAGHAAEFAKVPWNAPKAPEPAKDDLSAVLEGDDATVAEKPKRSSHRAQSQQASPEDYQAIAALTKELREAEAELSKLKPDALKADPPRVRTIKRQIAAVKAELAEAKPKPAPVPAVQPQPLYQPAPAQPVTLEEPKLEQFQNEEDPYGALILAKVEHRQRVQAMQAQQAAQQAQDAQRTQQQQAAIAQEVEQTQARVKAFVQAHPDYQPKFQAFVTQYPHIPELLGAALAKSDKSPDLMYYFFDHPDHFDEHVFDAEGKPVTDQAVAVLQRRLHARLAAVSTGSAPPAQPVIAPRPPNPVRTAPSMPRVEVPGDNSSLSDHARAFHRSRR